MLMPNKLPCTSTKAPPELPGLMAASVWMKFSKVLMPSWLRPSADTMPLVTVCPTPKGFPMANTMSPTWTCSELFITITGSLSKLTLSTAKSVSGSVPMILACVWRPSLSITKISSAASTTWLFVSMYPCGLTMTPLPKPDWAESSWSPKK